MAAGGGFSRAGGSGGRPRLKKVECSVPPPSNGVPSSSSDHSSSPTRQHARANGHTQNQQQQPARQTGDVTHAAHLRWRPARQGHPRPAGARRHPSRCSPGWPRIQSWAASGWRGPARPSRGAPRALIWRPCRWALQCSRGWRGAAQARAGAAGTRSGTDSPTTPEQSRCSARRSRSTSSPGSRRRASTPRSW